MPIDPSIPLSVRPFQMRSPVEAFQTAQQMRSNALVLQQQEEAARLRQAEQERQALAQRITAQFAKNGPPDWTQVANALDQNGLTDYAAGIRKRLADEEKDRLELESKRLGNQKTQFEIEQQPLEAQRKAEEAARLGAKEQRDAMQFAYDMQRFRQQDAQKAAEAATKLGSMFLSRAQNAEQWNATLGTMKQMGADDGVLAQFGEFSPENVKRAAVLGMTPEQQEQLRISQGNLSVSQRNAATAAANAAKPDYEKIETVDEQGRPVTRYMTPEEVRAAGGVVKPGASTGKDMEMATRIIDEIESLSSKINTSSSGPGANVAGAFRRGAAALNMDNDVKEYQRLVEGFIPMIARAVGHTGVLTQQDVDSVRALFPAPGDNKQVSENMLARVRRLLAASGQTQAPEGAPLSQVLGAAMAAAEDGLKVRMKAPDGRMLEVPASDVERLKALGAVVVR